MAKGNPQNDAVKVGWGEANFDFGAGSYSSWGAALGALLRLFTGGYGSAAVSFWGWRRGVKGQTQRARGLGG